jgi:hypothetical protein
MSGAAEARQLRLHLTRGGMVDHVSHNIGVSGLLQERTKHHRVVCTRRRVGSGQVSQTNPAGDSRHLPGASAGARWLLRSARHPSLNFHATSRDAPPAPQFVRWANGRGGRLTLPASTIAAARAPLSELTGQREKVCREIHGGNRQAPRYARHERNPA